MKTLYVPHRDKLASAEQIAFVVCGYHGDDGSQSRSFLRRALRRLRLTAIHDNDLRVMNWYANPRTLPYLVALLEEFREMNGLQRPGHLYADEKLGGLDALEGPKRTDGRSFSFSRLPELRSYLKDGGYEAVVLVYADAIGLGCQPVERIAREVSGMVVIVNGRRRAFSLDRPTRRALRWRRALSRWRVDWALAFVFLPLAAFFSMKDAFAQRKHG